MLFVKNNHAEIIETNFWQTAWNARGLFLVSVNARAFRVLVPDARALDITEMQTGRAVTVTRYKGRVNIVFDDGSPAPYTLQLDERQFDRLPAPEDSGRSDLLCTVWMQGQDGRPQKVLSLPARYLDRR